MAGRHARARADSLIMRTLPSLVAATAKSASFHYTPFFRRNRRLRGGCHRTDEGPASPSELWQSPYVTAYCSSDQAAMACDRRPLVGDARTFPEQLATPVRTLDVFGMWWPTLNECYAVGTAWPCQGRGTACPQYGATYAFHPRLFGLQRAPTRGRARDVMERSIHAVFVRCGEDVPRN